MTSLSTSGWRAGLILSRLSESKTDSASHVVPSNSSRHEGGTPEATEERKLTLLKVSFLSVSSSGVPPSCLQGRSGLGAPAPPLDAALNRQRNVSFTPYDGTHHPTHKQGRPGVKKLKSLTSQTN